MKKYLLGAAVLCSVVSCSSMPDGIDKDAFAPYSPEPRTLMCNTTRGLGISSFSASNDCLYYEFDNKEDREAAGFYQRVSEEKAHVIIRSDDTYEVEYVLTFTNHQEGSVEEKYTVDGYTETYKGNFTLR